MGTRGCEGLVVRAGLGGRQPVSPTCGVEVVAQLLGVLAYVDSRHPTDVYLDAAARWVARVNDS